VRTVTVDLAEPIHGHEGPIRQVVLREPRFAEVTEIGEIWQFVPAAPGDERGPTPVLIDAAVREYILRCVEKPDAALLAQLSLVDTMKLRQEVVGFFGRAGLTLMRGSATSSSSTSGSSPSPTPGG
jgi:hypothetical protein